MSTPIPADSPPPSGRLSVLSYLLVTLGCLSVALLAIVVVVAIRPHEDNMAVITLIAGMSVPTIAAILGLVKSEQNGQAVQGVHRELNNRLSEWRSESEDQRQSVKAAAEKTVTMAADAADKAIAAALAAADKAIAAAAQLAAETATRAYATGKAEGLAKAQIQQGNTSDA